MISIAVCDDEEFFRNEVCYLLEMYSCQFKVDIKVDCYESGELLLSSNIVYDLYLIDYKMNGIDGIKTAKYLRINGKDAPIVFLTNYKNAMQEAFTVNAYRYLIKENYKMDIDKCITDYINDYCTQNIIKIDNGNDYIIIPTRNIMHIISAHNGTELWLSEGSLKSALSLIEWEKKLCKNLFFRCHRNSIVNLNYIKKVENYIILTNNERVELSRRNRKKLKEAIVNYINKFVR